MLCNSRLPSEEVQARAAGKGPNPKGYFEMRNKGSNGYGGQGGGADWLVRLLLWLMNVMAAAVIGQCVVKLLEAWSW